MGNSARNKGDFPPQVATSLFKKTALHDLQKIYLQFNLIIKAKPRLMSLESIDYFCLWAYTILKNTLYKY